MTTALQDTVRDIQRKINVKDARIKEIDARRRLNDAHVQALTRETNRMTREKDTLVGEIVALRRLEKSINDFYGSPPAVLGTPEAATLARHGTMPVEGPARYLFLRDRIESHSDPNKSYEVKVVGYEISPTLVRVAVFCNCPGFTFTRGKVSNGEKADCKHIADFKARVRWLEAATWEARQQGYTGDLTFRHPDFGFQQIHRG